MDERLLVPVSLLPGPLPAGAPQAGRCECSPEPVALPAGVLYGCCGTEEYALDLSPPPTDAAGWPMRIDGLDVAAGMLARAMGRGGPDSVTLGPDGLVFWFDDGEPCTEVHIDGVVYRIDSERVPALADIDPADPLAPRLAMAAVLRAQPWVRS